MKYCGFATHKLPDIAMYGGDTTPWVITLTREDGSILDDLGGNTYECILSISPFAHSYGMSGSASVFAPLLLKSSPVVQVNSGQCTSTFAFIMEDTIHLRGKYIYQIEVRSGINNRVCQGNLTILENKNRKAGA